MAANSQFSMAVHVLSMLARSKDENLKSDEIAGSVNTNAVVIRRLLGQLGHANLVISQTGANGGTRLARCPNEINLWDIYKAIIAADGIVQRLIVMPPGAPAAAVAALRAAIIRVNADPAYAEEAEKTFGFVPQWAAGPDTSEVAQGALTVRPEVRSFLSDYMKNLLK